MMEYAVVIVIICIAVISLIYRFRQTWKNDRCSGCSERDACCKGQTTDHDACDKL
jgi:hypothetical protein